MNNTFYVDPKEEAKKYGIEVIKDKDTELKNNENGMIIKENDKITIYVRSSDSPERQRFTIAHELGHYVCGHLTENKKMFRDGKKEYSRDNYDIEEYEANNYAAELLMPQPKVNFLIERENITDVRKMAQIFKVSLKAMVIRLKNLGWIKNEYY